MPANAAAMSFLKLPQLASGVLLRVLTIRNQIRRLVTGHDAVLDAITDFKTVIMHLTATLMRAKWIVTTIPSLLGHAEAAETINMLERGGWQPHAVCINQFWPKPRTACDFCRHEWQESVKWTTAIIELAASRGVNHTFVIEHTLQPGAIRAQLIRNLFPPS